jgi:hypothetical protein
MTSKDMVFRALDQVPINRSWNVFILPFLDCRKETLVIKNPLILVPPIENIAKYTQ